MDFSAWSRNRSREESRESLDRAIKEIVKAVGGDPRADEAFSGRKMIKICDFRRRITEHFAPRIVTIEFFDDKSGLNFIKVDNGDTTFQFYEYWSRPSGMDLLNEVFREPDEPLIIDLAMPGTIVWTGKERDEVVAEIRKRYGLSEKEFWDAGNKGPELSGAQRAAWDEYWQWLFEQEPISLVHEGDFGRRGR